jgi:hypothetical protein
MKMNKKLLVLDLDGTLTNSRKEITSKTLDALHRLQQAGHTIVLASGRPTAGIKQVADALELETQGGYVLAFNGARIIDWRTQEVLFQQTLEHAYLQRLYDAAVAHGLTILTYRDEYALAGTPANEYAEFEAKINHMILTPVEQFAEYVDFPINKCLMSGAPEHVKACEDELLPELGDCLSIFKSEDFFLEIMAKDIDKAASLDRLVNLLGMTREQVVCCGDGYNDISMIQYAGVGVAMDNAKDVVKEVADVVTGSNDEDGLVPIVEKYFLS